MAVTDVIFGSAVSVISIVLATSLFYINGDIDTVLEFNQLPFFNLQLFLFRMRNLKIQKLLLYINRKLLQ